MREDMKKHPTTIHCGASSCRHHRHRHSRSRSLSSVILLQVLVILISLQYEGFALVNSLTVAVFGGSGFVGRRISQTLIEAGCDVISISRSGKPPPYYCNNDRDGTGTAAGTTTSSGWADQVTWIRHDMDHTKNQIQQQDQQQDQKGKIQSCDEYKLPKIDAAISCIGNINPDQEWLKSSFFGLAFNDERLYYENGILNANAVQMAKEAGAKRFVYLSVSYETAKMLEGAIAGYISGKRHAEHEAYTQFVVGGGDKTENEMGTTNDNDNDNDNDNGAIIIGPSFIYGGKRFPKAGNLYRKFIESIIAKMYVRSNESLRNLSSAPMEDWVEKTLFSPPISVDVVARVASAAAIGFVTRDMVGERRQGFFNTKGKSVLYDDIVSVDGTLELERVDKDLKIKLMQWKEGQGRERKNQSLDASSSLLSSSLKGENKNVEKGEPSFEGALIGKKPLLYPLPVVTFFSTMFYLISSGQFVTN